jgi:glycosyltransferase involved in cell wall biosynthesis
MNCFKFINLIKLTIFCNLIIIGKKLGIYPTYLHPFYLPYNKPILLIDRYQNETLNNGRNYLDKCLNLVNNNKYKLIEIPKASVIIPLYNCQETIIPAINSIQYQNMTQIEIILINDFSSDNTSYIVENLQKNDQRIKIINNIRNMGTLYSRSIGALASRGEYIFNLDNDDIYFSHDLFDSIYKIGKNENLDIISFLAINIWNYSSNVIYMKNLFSIQFSDEFYLKQPDLGMWIIKYKEKFLVHNNMIWDKCINSSIYQKAVNLMGIQKYSQYVSWAEDTSINFIIFKLAKSFKYTNKYGLVHFKGRNTASSTQSINSRIFGDIFFLNIMLDFSSNNKKEKNLIVGQLFYIYKRYNYFKFNNDTNSYLLKNVISKIITRDKFLSKLNKRKIKKIFKSFF